MEWARNNKEVGAKKIMQNNMDGLVHPKIRPSSSDPESVSLEEILKIASYDFGESLVFQRDLAAVCFAFLSGARAGAIASAPINSIHLAEMMFLQDTELGVATKNSKSAHTFLLPIPELVAIVKRWDDKVRANLPETALWYAPLEAHWGESNFTNNVAGENRANALNKRFGVVYEKAGMGELYKSPHKFRHGFAIYGLSKCKDMSSYQAVSRNLMHSSLAITDKIYAVIEEKERKNIIASLVPNYQPVIETDLEEYLNQICREDRLKAISILSNSLQR